MFERRRTLSLAALGAFALVGAALTWFGNFGPATLDRVLTVGVVVVFAAGIAFMYSTREAKPGCCRTCGYSLRGNVSGRCPECGTAIERTDGPKV